MIRLPINSRVPARVLELLRRVRFTSSPAVAGVHQLVAVPQLQLLRRRIVLQAAYVVAHALDLARQFGVAVLQALGLFLLGEDGGNSVRPA